MHTLNRIFLALSLFLAALLLSHSASPQDAGPAASTPPIVWSAVPIPSAVPGEKDPGAAISPMKKGQRAPFTGVLLSPTAVATIITMYATLPETIAVEKDMAVAQCQAKCDHTVADGQASCNTRVSVKDAELKRVGDENAKLRKTVSDLESKQSKVWPAYVWAGIGAVGGIGLTLGVVYLTHQATK